MQKDEYVVVVVVVAIVATVPVVAVVVVDSVCDAGVGAFCFDRNLNGTDFRLEPSHGDWHVVEPRPLGNLDRFRYLCLIEFLSISFQQQWNVMILNGFVMKGKWKTNGL